MELDPEGGRTMMNGTISPTIRSLGLRATLAALLAAALAGAGLAPASAEPPVRPTPTMMTYNVYLGANLQPLFGENDPIRLIQKAAAIVAHFDEVDFRVRAVAIARQIIEQDPDVLALQEVSLLEIAPTGMPFATRYDFLQILLDELERQGHPFRAVTINPNFTGTLPIDFVGTRARLTDRNVIIVPSDPPASELATSNPAQDVYDRTLDVPLGGTIFHGRRGWASIDVVFEGAPFRLFNTHFEAFDSSVREDQVGELAEIMSASRLPVVLAGDINLYPRGVRALDEAAWRVLSGDGFRDAWVVAECFEPRFTAGQTDDLDNVPSILDNTVDFVLFDKDFETKTVEGSCDIAGEELDDRTDTVPALWPSDHAAVIVHLRLARP
jgi:endonuclease/exonuclease/phosphatase family metal-dependent hydrolase